MDGKARISAAQLATIARLAGDSDVLVSARQSGHGYEWNIVGVMDGPTEAVLIDGTIHGQDDDEPQMTMNDCPDRPTQAELEGGPVHG